MNKNLATYLIVTFVLCAGMATAEPPAKRHDPSWVRPRLSGTASHSGGFSLDESKLRKMFPKFKWTADQIAYLDEHLRLGDSRGAIVASVKPLVVSAYSDELDAVILVQFPDALVSQYSLAVGDKLIASWVYPPWRIPPWRQAPSDVVKGRGNSGRYDNGVPIIADFFSNSVDKIKKRKLGVSTGEWQRVRSLTPAALKRANGKYRTSFPLATGRPPELLETSPVKK